MKRYLISYARSNLVRLSITLLGAGLSVSGILLAYGLAFSVSESSTAVLRLLFAADNIWISSGPIGLDPETGSPVAPGTISQSSIDQLTKEGFHVRRVRQERFQNHGVVSVVYCDDGIASGERPTARAGTPSVRFLPFHDCDELGQPGKVTWAFVRAAAPVTVSRTIASALDASVTDEPSQLFASTPDTLLVTPLGGGLARFSPFSFSTKFSSLLVANNLSSIFGVTARLVFLLGILLSVSSALIGVDERRAEVATLSLLGLQGDLTMLFLIESALLQSGALLVGYALLFAMLQVLLPDGSSAATVSTIGVSVAYFFLMLALPALAAGQRVGSQQAADLVRNSA